MSVKNLKIELLSSLFEQDLRLFDKASGKKEANTLSVEEFHLHSLTGKRRARAKEFFVDLDEFFDPKYDVDFTNLLDSSECTRGDEAYKRPAGWFRLALKVKGKYPDGDAWLGTGGWRSHSVPGEWPVSYHGTSLQGAKGIIWSHYKAGERCHWGRGIYSTPDIHVAGNYTTIFHSKTTGRRYEVILQNRINPKYRRFCSKPDFWLIPVFRGATPEQERDIVERSIRPYGILIKKI